jgi:AbrB family looped-hinge helix DNA binding protein
MDTAMLTLDATGRVLLPSEIRRRLNLRPGTRLKLELLAERIELTVQADAPPALAAAPSKRRVLPPSGEPFDAAAATREERAAQARRRAAR